MTRKKEFEIKRLKDADDLKRGDIVKSYKIECEQKMREMKKKKLEKWFTKKEKHAHLMGDVVKSILDVVEELHFTCKGGITKPRWREIMRRFKTGEQIYTSQQVQMEPEPEEESDGEELDLTEHNEDYIELQNYLSAVGKWNPSNVIREHIKDVVKIAQNEDVVLPQFNNYVNNNLILGKAVKEMNTIAHHEEIDKVYGDQNEKLNLAKASIPSYMPLKLLLFGKEYDFNKEINNKLVQEFNLKIFDVNEITVELEKIINPPQEEEVQDPKAKAKGKVVQEEPPENAEEIKELSKIAEKVKQYREDNPGIQSLSEDHLIEVLAVKVKYSFKPKSDEDILTEIKEGIRADYFREPEDETDPKKAKGKGPSKEELEEELIKYKKVHPSGYMVINLPQNLETLIQYEKVFNGFTPLEERPETNFEKHRDNSHKIFPCSLSEQVPYVLEPNRNYLSHRSLTLTRPLIERELSKNEVILLEKNTPSELEKRFAILDPEYKEYKNLVEHFGTDCIHIPYKAFIDVSVNKVIPAVAEGEEPKEKTADQIQEEISGKFRNEIKKIIEFQQKVLDQIVEENIEVVKQEFEEEKQKVELEKQQKDNPPVEEAKIPDPTENTKPEGEGEGDRLEPTVEVEEPELPKIGFHPDVVHEIFSGLKIGEREYAKNMMNMFRSVRKQHENIGGGIEDMKSNFKDFMMKSDLKQEKLEHFIESFNKFTEEFPELRPDDQTKEELNNRCEILNDEFWDIIEANKDAAIGERKRLMTSGWIEQELQHLTIKAQQFIGFEIRRCINSLNFIHNYFLSHKAEKPLEECENRFPQKYSLSLLDESNAEGEQTELPKVEDPKNPNCFPLLNAIFAKALGIVNEIQNGLSAYSESDFDIINAINTEKEILVFRMIAVRNWTIHGLKDIRHKINESYNVLDDWIVVHINNENSNVNQIISHVREVIESNEPLDLDLRVNQSEIEVENEDQIQFIETTIDKSFTQNISKTKFSLYQAQEYFEIFKKFARDQYIPISKVKDIIVTNLRLKPDLIPQKWTEYQLSYVDNLLERVAEEDFVDWRHLLTFCILNEAFIPMVDRNSVTKTYKTNLKKAQANELDEYVTLNQFLTVGSWYDSYLTMRRKEDLQFEEDKQEVDQEIEDVKKLLYKINLSENGLLNVDTYINTILKLWPKI